MTDQPTALRLAAFCDGNVLYHPTAAELRRLSAVNRELLEALISFTKSDYIKKQHPKRYAAAVAAIAKAEGQA